MAEKTGLCATSKALPFNINSGSHSYVYEGASENRLTLMLQNLVREKVGVNVLVLARGEIISRCCKERVRERVVMLLDRECEGTCCYVGQGMCEYVCCSEWTEREVLGMLKGGENKLYDNVGQRWVVD